MRVFGDEVREELESEIDKLRKEIQSSRRVNFALTFVLFFVLFFFMRNTIISNDQHLYEAIEDNKAAISEIDCVSINDYNNLVNTLRSTQSSVAGLTTRMDSYESRLAQYNANVLSDFVSSQINGENVEPEFVENTVIQTSNDPLYYHNGVIDSNGYVDKDYFESVVDYYNMVPANVRNAFVNDGWHVMVTTDSIYVEGITDTVVAVTMFQEKMIYMSTLDAESIIHEMGHYVDGRNDFVSTTLDSRTYASDLNGFMQLDGATHVHNYSTTPEYFAECFYLYVTQPDNLKSYCPGTYDFIVESVNNIV